MYTTLLHQYQLLLGSREALLAYCEQISPEDLLKPVSTHNNDSMITLMLHSASTYLGWLHNFLGREQRPYFSVEEHSSLASVRQVFEQVNLVVNDFLQQHKDGIDVPIPLPREEGDILLTPLQLFTHVTTHEFHHKGQLLNMSRQLGYIPVDTDVIRT